MFCLHLLSNCQILGAIKFFSVYLADYATIIPYVEMFLQTTSKKEAFYEIQLIHNLFIDQCDFSILFANSFDSFQILEIIACLGQPVIWKPTYFHPIYELVQWTAKSIQMKLFNSPYHPTQSFYLKYIELFNEDKELSHYYETLIAFLPFDFNCILSTDNVVSANKNIERFFKSLLFLYKNDNSMFISLKPTINSQLHSITSKILFETFGLKVLKIYTGISPSEIQYFPFETVNNRNILKIINCLMLLDNPKVVEILQRLISFYETTKFLNESKVPHRLSILFLQDINFVLLNESVSNQKTFFDISMHKFQIELKFKEISNIFIKDSNNESDSIQNNNDFINPQFLPVSFPGIEFMLSSFFLAAYDKNLISFQILFSYSSDLLRLEKQINHNHESSYRTIMINLLDRISNDYYLLTFLEQTLGVKKSVDDLLSLSIPSQLKSILDHNINLSLINKTYFSLSDADVNIDCDFILCYEILSKVITFTISAQSNSFEDKEALIQQIKMISNDHLRNVLTVDIFSLLFLEYNTRDPNEKKYYCDLKKLPEILDLISDYFPDSTIFNAASAHITLANFQGSTNLEHAFITKSQMIDNFIKTREFDLAESLAFGNERLTYLVHLFKRLDAENCVINEVDLPKDSHGYDINYEGIFLIETYFSKGKTSQLISFFVHQNIFGLFDQNAKPLVINTKQHSENVFLAYPQPNTTFRKAHSIPQGHFVNESEQYQSFLCSAKDFYGIDSLISIHNLIAVHMEYNDPLSLFKSNSENDSLSSHYSSFNEYLKIYQEYQNNSNQNSDEQLTPNKIMEMIENSTTKVANFKSLTTLLGKYAIELIFLYKRSISYKLIDIIGAISPVTQLAALFQKALSNDFDTNHFNLYFHWPFTPFDNYMKRQCELFDHQNDSSEVLINNDADIIIQHIEDNLVEISDDDFDLIFDLSMKKKVYNNLNYLFYKSSFKFKELIFKNLNKFTLEDLHSLFPFCGFKSLKYLLLIFSDKAHFSTDILDFDKIVVYLLNHKKYDYILFFNEEFPFVTRIAKTIIEKKFSIYKEIPLNFLREFEIDNSFLKSLDVKINQFDSLKKRIQASTPNLKNLIDELDRSHISIQSLKVNEINDLIHLVVNRYINHIQVDSETNELYLSKQFCRLAELFSNVEILQFEIKIETIGHFLAREIQNHFGISYSMTSFNMSEFGERMATLCLKFDYHQELLAFCKGWSIDISWFVLNRALGCFRLNLLDIGLSYISSYKNNFSISNLFNKNGSKPANQFQIKNEIINVLSYHIIFDLQSASKSENEISTFHILKHKMIPMHQRIQQIIHRNETIITSSPQITSLRQLFLMMNDYEDLIEFYAAMNDFQCALSAFDENILKSANNYSYQRDVFITSLVCPAVSTNGWNTFLLNLKKNKDVYKQFIEDMFKFFQLQKMFFVAYSIQEKFGYFELAYKSSVAFYLNDRLSYDDRENCINTIIRPILYQLINSHINPKYYLNELEKVNLMSNINQDFRLNQIPFNSNLEIFSIKEHAIKVAIITMDSGLLDITMQMIQLNYFSKDEICRSYLDYLFHGNQNVEEKLKAFCQNIQNMDNEMYESFIMTFFYIMDTIVSNKAWLQSFIDKNVKQEVKGILFIQCGFLDDAFQIAKKTHDVHLMTVVNDEAKSKNNETLYKQSTDILQKWK